MATVISGGVTAAAVAAGGTIVGSWLANLFNHPAVSGAVDTSGSVTLTSAQILAAMAIMEKLSIISVSELTIANVQSMVMMFGTMGIPMDQTVVQALLTQAH